MTENHQDLVGLDMKYKVFRQIGAMVSCIILAATNSQAQNVGWNFGFISNFK